MLSAVAVGLYLQENGTNDQRRHSVGSFFICWAHDRRTCFYTVSFPFILGHFFPLLVVKRHAHQHDWQRRESTLQDI